MSEKLIETINNQTPISINLAPIGYAWTWRCLESKRFASPQLALIDWINYVCQAYEDVLIESLKEDDEIEEDNPEHDRLDSYYEVIEI